MRQSTAPISDRVARCGALGSDEFARCGCEDPSLEAYVTVRAATQLYVSRVETYTVCRCLAGGRQRASDHFSSLRLLSTVLLIIAVMVVFVWAMAAQFTGGSAAAVLPKFAEFLFHPLR